MKIGILGTGNLAAYLVQGAQQGGHQFVLSPRGAAKAADLAARFGCTVAASNQAVVDACDHILVCLPAAEGLAVLRGLTFRAGQEVRPRSTASPSDRKSTRLNSSHRMPSRMPSSA